MAQTQKQMATYQNRCERCNRQLKDPGAQYGWQCAEILGVTRNLNYSGDGAFHAYMLGMNKANAFLQKNKIDSKKINLTKFYESYAKQYLASGMNNRKLFDLAYADMYEALSLTRDRFGNAIFQPPKAPSVSAMLNARDIFDYQNGKYTTTTFTNNSFDPYTHRLQRQLNTSGVTDRFGNRLKEDGILGPKTQLVHDTVVWQRGNRGILLLSAKAHDKDKGWQGNPNKRKGSENRKPSGDRERNVGHPDGEEHSRVPKGSGGKARSRGPMRSIGGQKIGRAMLGGIAVAGTGYLIYRGIRMLPSLLPPLWWTIPGNLVIP